MNTQRLIDEALVAASVAEQNQFVGTQKALLQLVVLLQEQQKAQEAKHRQFADAAPERVA